MNQLAAARIANSSQARRKRRQTDLRRHANAKTSVKLHSASTRACIIPLSIRVGVAVGSRKRSSREKLGSSSLTPAKAAFGGAVDNVALASASVEEVGTTGIVAIAHETAARTVSQEAVKRCNRARDSGDVLFVPPRGIRSWGKAIAEGEIVLRAVVIFARDQPCSPPPLRSMMQVVRRAESCRRRMR